jgi:hypothetical protein
VRGARGGGVRVTGTRPWAEGLWQGVAGPRTGAGAVDCGKRGLWGWGTGVGPSVFGRAGSAQQRGVPA